MLSRVSDWQGRLDRFFQQRRDVCFHYGGQDCCLFACDAILAMTDVDIAYEFRGLYGARSGAMRAAKQITGKASVRAITEHVTDGFQMPKVAPLLLQRGDVALIRRPPRDYSLGVVSLNGSVLVVPVATGTAEVPLDSAIYGWRV